MTSSDSRIDVLDSMLSKTASALNAINDRHFDLSTPCEDFTVADLLNHVAVWIQVFDGAVNDFKVAFDPMTHRINKGHVATFANASESIMRGLRSRGFDRPMTMTQDPMPGEFILNMLLMEYVGHAWDLTQAIGQAAPHSDDEARAALTAAQEIIMPQYRGTGMFGEETSVRDTATPIEKYVAFIGRNLEWKTRKS